MPRLGRILATCGTLVLLAGACLLDVNGTATIGAGGVGGETAVGGGGGQAPTCIVEECPPASGPCVTPACRDQSCGEESLPSGRPCGDNGETCDGFGACKLPLGAGCQEDDACITNQCVDEVCCNAPCTGGCESCTLEGQEGTCTPLPPGTDTNMACGEGSCDGLGACATGLFQNAGTYGSDGSQRGWDLALDTAGDVVLSGSFEGTFDFAGQVLTATTGIDPFVIKLSPDHQSVRWATTFPTSDDSQSNYAREVEVDAMGDVIVCGNFRNDIVLVANDGKLEGAGGNSDIFVAKLEGATGVPLWGKVFGTSGLDACQGMTLDQAGDVYFAGFNEAEITFGTAPLPYGGGEDAYLVKLDGSNGNHLWSRAFGGTNDQRIRDVQWFDNTLFIGGLARDNIALMNANAGLSNKLNVFLARLDGNGNPIWDRVYDNGQDNGLNELALGPTGHPTASGYFRNTLDFGVGGAVTANGEDAYVLQLDANDGSPRWVKTFGGSGDQTSYALDLGADGQVVVGFDFTDGIVIDPIATMNASATDNALVKLAADGTPLWARHHGGGGNELSESVLVVDGSDARIVFTGWFTDQLTVNQATQLSQDQDDLFLTVHSP